MGCLWRRVFEVAVAILVIVCPICPTVKGFYRPELTRVNFTSFGHRGNNAHPHRLNVSFRSHGHDFDIQMFRNSDISLDDIPTLLLESRGNDAQVFQETVHQNVSFYQDRLRETTFSLCTTQNNTTTLVGHVVRYSASFFLRAHVDDYYIVERRALGRGHKLANDVVKSPRGTARAKRDTSSSTTTDDIINAKVQLLVILDYSLYRKYVTQYGTQDDAVLEMKKYFAHVINGVDNVFRNIKDPRFNIRVFLAGFVISTMPSTSPWYENNVLRQETDNHGALRTVVNGYQAIDDMSFQMARYTRNLTFPEYDHAISFTSYDLTDRAGETATLGMAYKNGICKFTDFWVHAISLVEETGSFESILTAAHELAHSLGADHDGEESRVRCDPADQFLMSPSSELSGGGSHANMYHLSCCSIQQLRETLSRGNAQCILEPAQQHISFYDLVTDVTGQEFPADEQCSQRIERGSRLCQWVYDDYPAIIMCEELWCTDPTFPARCFYAGEPAIGTECYPGYWCVQGACVSQNQTVTTDHLPGLIVNPKYVCCPLPRMTLPHGEVTHYDHELWYGSEAHYSCSPGFTYQSGDLVRTCGLDARWSGSQPVCVATTQTTPSISSTTVGTTTNTTTLHKDLNGTTQGITVQDQGHTSGPRLTSTTTLHTIIDNTAQTTATQEQTSESHGLKTTETITLHSILDSSTHAIETTLGQALNTTKSTVTETTTLLGVSDESTHGLVIQGQSTESDVSLTTELTHSPLSDMNTTEVDIIKTSTQSMIRSKADTSSTTDLPTSTHASYLSTVLSKHKTRSTTPETFPMASTGQPTSLETSTTSFALTGNSFDFTASSTQTAINLDQQQTQLTTSHAPTPTLRAKHVTAGVPEFNITADVDEYVTTESALNGTRKEAFTTENVVNNVSKEAFTTENVVNNVSKEAFTTENVVNNVSKGAFTTVAIMDDTTNEVVTNKARNFTTKYIMINASTGYSTTEPDINITGHGEYTTESVINITRNGEYITESVINITRNGEYTTESVINITRNGEYTTESVINITRNGENTTESEINITRNGENTTESGINITRNGENTTESVINITRNGEYTESVINITRNGENTTESVINITRNGENTTESVINITRNGENTTESGINITRNGENTTESVINITQNGEYTIESEQFTTDSELHAPTITDKQPRITKILPVTQAHPDTTRGEVHAGCTCVEQTSYGRTMIVAFVVAMTTRTYWLLVT